MHQAKEEELSVIQKQKRKLFKEEALKMRKQWNSKRKKGRKENNAVRFAQETKEKLLKAI